MLILMNDIGNKEDPGIVSFTFDTIFDFIKNVSRIIITLLYIYYANP
jgi:hypothetical protein